MSPIDAPPPAEIDPAVETPHDTDPDAGRGLSDAQKVEVKNVELDPVQLARVADIKSQLAVLKGKAAARGKVIDEERGRITLARLDAEIDINLSTGLKNSAMVVLEGRLGQGQLGDVEKLFAEAEATLARIKREFEGAEGGDGEDGLIMRHNAAAGKPALAVLAAELGAEIGQKREERSGAESLKHILSEFISRKRQFEAATRIYEHAKKQFDAMHQELECIKLVHEMEAAAEEVLSDALKTVNLLDACIEAAVGVPAEFEVFVRKDIVKVVLSKKDDVGKAVDEVEKVISELFFFFNEEKPDALLTDNESKMRTAQGYLRFLHGLALYASVDALETIEALHGLKTLPPPGPIPVPAPIALQAPTPEPAPALIPVPIPARAPSATADNAVEQRSDAVVPVVTTSVHGFVAASIHSASTMPPIVREPEAPPAVAVAGSERQRTSGQHVAALRRHTLRMGSRMPPLPTMKPIEPTVEDLQRIIVERDMEISRLRQALERLVTQAATAETSANLLMLDVVERTQRAKEDGGGGKAPATVVIAPTPDWPKGKARPASARPAAMPVPEKRGSRADGWRAFLGIAPAQKPPRKPGK